MIKKHGIDIDEIGIMSVFFKDEKIISMSIDIIDNKMSSALLSNAPSKYAKPLYELIDNINRHVMLDMHDTDDMITITTAIRNYTSTYNG